VVFRLPISVELALRPNLLSGILSLPWSPLSSRPPEVDVPLPPGLALVEAPVVGALPAVAELAAGSPLTEPRPLGSPFCAFDDPSTTMRPHGPQVLFS
jgi:hypothetical protein